MNLSEALTGGAVLHMGAAVAHARRGPLAHSFNYTTDYVLLAPEHAQGRRFFHATASIFSRSTIVTMAANGGLVAARNGRANDFRRPVWIAARRSRLRC